jgi:hypothetical protein
VPLEVLSAALFPSASVGTTSAALAGAVTAVVFLAGVLAQLWPGRLDLGRQLTAGVAGSLVLFVVAGAGAGLLFEGAMGSAARMAEPTARGEAAAGIFLAGYAGLPLPVLGLGAAARWVSLTTGLTAFCLVILVVLTGVGLQLRALRA